MRRTTDNSGNTRESTLVRDVLVVLVVALLIWSVWLEVQVGQLNRKVAKLTSPIVVAADKQYRFNSIDDIALSVVRLHEREQGLEASIEEDIHSGGRTMIHTHQYIDRKVWAADATERDLVKKLPN